MKVKWKGEDGWQRARTSGSWRSMTWQAQGWGCGGVQGRQADVRRSWGTWRKDITKNSCQDKYTKSLKLVSVAVVERTKEQNVISRCSGTWQNHDSGVTIIIIQWVIGSHSNKVSNFYIIFYIQFLHNVALIKLFCKGKTYLYVLFTKKRTNL